MLTLLGDRPRGRVDRAGRRAARRGPAAGARRAPRHASTSPTTGRPPRSTCCSRSAGRSRGPARRSTAHVSVVDAARHRLRDHRVVRLRLGRHGPRHRAVAEQLPRRARAQPGARCAPGERLRSNMAPTVGRRDDGAVLAARQPGRRPHHDRPAAGPRARSRTAGRPCRRRSTGRACTCTTSTRDDPDGPTRVEAEEDLPLPHLDLPVRRHHRHSMYFGGVGAALRLGSGAARGGRRPAPGRRSRRQPLRLPSRPAGAARGRTSSRR